MNVEIIHSGSSGNCAVIDNEIIIDMGWNVTPEGNYVFLTHHHTDHTKHLQNVGGLPIYCLQETADKLMEKYPYTAFNTVEPNKQVEICTLFSKYIIIPKLMRHDAPCVGYDITRIEDDVPYARIFFATDFNSMVDEDDFIRALRDKRYDAIYIECNNTLSAGDFHDVYFGEGKPPKDEFHRRKSYENHCNIGYLITLFNKAGYNETNRFTEPVTLLHKSSYYYAKNPNRVATLCKIANVVNPLF